MYEDCHTKIDYQRIVMLRLVYPQTPITECIFVLQICMRNEHLELLSEYEEGFLKRKRFWSSLF